jgi:hypothetical protein
LESDQEEKVRDLREELQAAKRKIKRLETDLAGISKEPEIPNADEVRELLSTVDDAAFQAITNRVFTLMRKDPSYISRADLEALARADGDSNLTQRIDDLEKEMYHTAGSVPQALGADSCCEEGPV